MWCLGCIRKGHDKDEQLVSNTVEQLLSLVDCSPDLARVRAAPRLPQVW